MEFSDFTKLLSADARAKASKRTLEIWHYFYLWIAEKGSADTADDEQFLSYVSERYEFSKTTTAKHLRRMADARLIDGHELRRKMDKLLLMMSNPYWNPMPTRFVRYTLPGKEVSLH